MPIDPSIPLGIKIPEFANPLAIAQQGATLQNSLNQNQLFRSKVAAGQAFQQSIGPDGVPNQNKLLQGLAGNPMAAASAQDSSLQGQALQNSSQGRGIQAQTAVNQGIASLLTLPDAQLNGQVVRQKISALVQAGAITPQDAQAAEADLPPDGSPPTAYRAYSVRHLAANLGGPEQAQGILGSPVDLNTGQVRSGGVQAGMLSPTGPGAITPVGQGTPVGLPSPTVQASQVTWKDQNGVEQFGTYAQYATERGMGHVVTPPTPVSVGAPGNGRMPPLAAVAAPPGAAQPPVGPGTAQAAPPPPAAAPSGLVSTPGPAPGVAEAAGATGLAAAKMGTELTARADQVPANKSNYANMLNDLQKLNSMGPGTGRETLINGFVQKLTGMGISMDRSQIAGAESFAKIANMIAASQLGSLGPTDARQSLAMGANPHLDLSKLGNEQIIHMLQGNEDAIAAKNRAWQQWIAPKSQGGLGNSPATYGQFSNDFNHNFDPRVFQQQYMTPQEISQMRKSMNGPGEVAKFKADFTYAKEHGWLGGG